MTVYFCNVVWLMEGWTESVHKTKAGAYKAGRKWLINEFNKSYEARALCGKSDCDFMLDYTNFKVVPMEVFK